jgi:plasmid maintenance system killer protein
MIITSEEEALLELYTNGRTSDKRYRSLSPQVIKGFKRAVDYMIAARRIEDLFPLKGLNYEALKGKRKGQESVRCNGAWRLIFRSYPIDGSVIITNIELLEISHHYD